MTNIPSPHLYPCCPPSLSVHPWVGWGIRAALVRPKRVKARLLCGWDRKAPVALWRTSPLINPHEQAAQQQPRWHIQKHYTYKNQRTHKCANCSYIITLTRPRRHAHKSNAGLKATQEVFLQGWTHRILCLAVFSTHSLLLSLLWQRGRRLRNLR